MYIFKFLLSLSLWIGTAIAEGSDPASDESVDTFTQMEMLYGVLTGSFQGVYCNTVYFMKIYPKKNFIRKPIKPMYINNSLFQELHEIYEAHRDSPESLGVNFRQTIQRYKHGTLFFERAARTIQHFFETVTHTFLNQPISCLIYTQIPI